jgi:Zn-dependent protease
MFERGYLTVLRVGGTRLRLHFTLPLAGLVLCRAQPGAWLGFVLVVVLHELGHALMVKRYRLKMGSIDLDGAGGSCRWVGNATERQRAAIAWGGLVAQALVALGTVAVTRALGHPASALGRQLVEALTAINLWLLAINLLPIPPLDGAEAWSLFRRRPPPRPRVRASEPSDEGYPPLTDAQKAQLRRVLEDARRRSKKFDN